MPRTWAPQGLFDAISLRLTTLTSLFRMDQQNFFGCYSSCGPCAEITSKRYHWGYGLCQVDYTWRIDCHDCDTHQAERRWGPFG
jgi:hypothetical protein